MSTEKKTDKEKQDEEEEEGEEAPIRGDVLESIFSHVSLVQLVPTSHVSKSWNHAVFSSLRHFKRIKPWLIIYAQSRRSPHATTTHAYDPRSDVWIKVNQTSIKYVSALRSSHSSLLYMLSPSKFSFSVDPLHMTWRHVDAPLVWRTDPIVAAVGQHVVVAAGACDFEDDPLAVETYDMETGAWDRCESMPAVLKDSAASTWLSIAANSEKMYVSEKRSGTTYSFDPNNKTWRGPYHLRPDDDVSFSEIGFVDDRLILVGILGDGDENVKGVKVWEVINDTDESLGLSKEIGVLPKECLEKLKGEESCLGLSSLSLNSMGNLVFLHNPEEPREMILCEKVDGLLCGWRIVRNVVVGDGNRTVERLVLTCSSVSIGDLRKAFKNENCSFSVKERE